MHIPTLSLVQTRQHVTELVRSPRAAAALGPSTKHPSRRAAPDPAAVSAPSDPAVGVPLATTPPLALQPDQSV